MFTFGSCGSLEGSVLSLSLTLTVKAKHCEKEGNSKSFIIDAVMILLAAVIESTFYWSQIANQTAAD